MNKYKVLYKYLFDLLVYLASFLLAFRSIIMYSKIEYSVIIDLVAPFSWLILFLSIMCNGFAVREISLSIILMLFSLLVYKSSSSLIPFYSMLFFVASKNRNLNKIIFANFLGMLFAVIRVILLAIGGKIPNIYYDGGMALGFRNPNVLSFYIAAMLVYWVYLRYHKIDFFELLFLFVISTPVHILTNSRTGLVLSLLILFFVFLTKTSYKMKSYFIRYSSVLCISIVLFCFLGIVLVNINPIFAKVNSILSGRFSLAQIYIGIYGLHPFGANIDDARSYGFGNIVLDNGYARLLINYGLYLVLFCGLYLGLLRNNRKYYKDVRLSIVVLIIFIGLVSETLLIPINSNILICLSSVIFFDGSKKIKFGESL